MKKKILKEDHGEQASPQTSPKAVPSKEKKEKKKSQGKDPKAQGLDAEEVSRITKLAIDDITSGIKDPNSQKKTVFVPSGWGTKYKPVLGNYKQFLKTCGAFVIADDVGSNFVIKLSSDPSAQQGGPSKTPWKIDLLRAWESYTGAVPRADRSMAGFAAVLKDDPSARHYIPSSTASPRLSPMASPKLTPASSPKLSPKASPQVAAASEKARKKAKRGGR